MKAYLLSHAVQYTKTIFGTSLLNFNYSKIMEILFLFIAIPFFYYVFFKIPKKDGSRRQCPSCGSKNTKSQGVDYASARKGGKVNNMVRCLDCNRNFVASGPHDSAWL